MFGGKIADDRPRSLVIGANGFLGSRLVDELDAAGHDVSALDRYTTGVAGFSSTSARMVKADFFDPAALAMALKGQDNVFHFLSTTDPATSEDDPLLDLQTNVISTVNLLEESATAGVERFYFASTGGAIYGDQGRELYSEESPTRPQSPYAIGKLTIERYLQYFRIKRGLNSVALRISNPYGPGQHPQRRQGLIPIALRNVALGKPVVRFGDGEMVRDYLFVDDAARMIAALALGEPDRDVYNIGSGQGHSVNEVLAVIEDVVGRPIEIETLPAPRTFVRHAVLDVGRYRGEFGASPLTSLAAGVARTWDSIQASGG